MTGHTLPKVKIDETAVRFSQDHYAHIDGFGLQVTLLVSIHVNFLVCCSHAKCHKYICVTNVSNKPVEQDILLPLHSRSMMVRSAGKCLIVSILM